jgi:hypothetical protein
MELSGKRPVMLSNFSKNVRQRYPTFRKKFVEVHGLFEKFEGSKRTSPRQINQETLPDFPKKGRQSYRTF